ncbi:MULTISPECIES: ATP-binding protein [unclassified Rathayibacter]|uniref:ATP-binding protein n=1 Tax=unclassified Rathayibacter TaxID=2609250 RepID=UPI00188ACC3C|nr:MULTISPECIES: ATP-binding protein [unclassified Rathayibacter]MBF4462112.1 ATP-binding protein [Rathayibacter sp. VKM Ac-2879]MBF4503845.1 ATP-binding protein [Rathayibacter sp. VKM Ac-2878]
MFERSLVLRTPPDDGVTAVHEALDELWAETSGLSSWDKMAFETALIEMTSNIVQHARSYRHVICLVEIRVDEHELRAVLTDSDDAAPADVTRPREMPEEWAEAGRGIPFIQALVTEFDYRRVDGQNIWTLMRSRHRS